MPCPTALRCRFPCCLAVGGILIGSAPVAQAHVKWFAGDADFSALPLEPERILLSPDFLVLWLLSVLALFVVLVLDARLRSNGAVIAAMLPAQNAALLRSCTGLYLAGLALHFHAAPVILAPELRTDAGWLPPLQLALALLFAYRRTTVPAAAGLWSLYSFAAAGYGAFHQHFYKNRRK